MNYYPMPIIPARVPGTSFVHLESDTLVTIRGTKYSVQSFDRTVVSLRDEDGAPFKITQQALYDLVIDKKTATVQRNRNTSEMKLLDLLYGDRRPEDYGTKDRLIAIFRQKLFVKYDKDCLEKGHIPRSKDGSFKAWIIREWNELVSRTVVPIPLTGYRDRRRFQPSSAATPLGRRATTISCPCSRAISARARTRSPSGSPKLSTLRRNTPSST
jgi:hypothetical protein